MSSTTLLRAAARSTFIRSPSVHHAAAAPRCCSLARPVVTARSSSSSSSRGSKAFSTTTSATRAADKDDHEGSSSSHHEETFEEFTARFEKEFDGVQDVFELQRNLNNAFAYDLVPAPSVLTAALKAARRVNDFPTAVRIFEGIKAKVENKGQYDQYLEELKPLREELGVALKEDLYPEDAK